MTDFSSHSQDYSGLPYVTYVTLRGIERTVVVDYVTDGIIRYYDVEDLAYDKASAFLTAVEEYQATKAREWPLSVFMSANGYSQQVSESYHQEELENISVIVGPCPSNWYPTIKTTWKRLDVKTGEITRSKNRRSREEIARDQLSKEQRIAAAQAARAEKIREQEAKQARLHAAAATRRANQLKKAEQLRDAKEIKAALRAERNAAVQQILFEQREARKLARRAKN